MGRTKSRKAQALAAAATKTAVASTSNPAPSIPSLLLKAQDLVTQCDYDLAEKFLQRVLEREPNHFEGREMLGLVELERGEFDSAREVLPLLPSRCRMCQ
jgi:Flp pilus assembly protein TadD